MNAMKIVRGAVRSVTRPVSREPVAIQALIVAFVNLLFVFSVIRLSVPQMGALNMFLVALLAFVARSAVTPVANPKDGEGTRLVPLPPWQRINVAKAE